MTGNGWKWLEMAGKCLKRMEMMQVPGNDQRWQEMFKNAMKWLLKGLKWMERTGNMMT